MNSRLISGVAALATTTLLLTGIATAGAAQGSQHASATLPVAEDLVATPEEVAEMGSPQNLVDRQAAAWEAMSDEELAQQEALRESTDPIVIPEDYAVVDPEDFVASDPAAPAAPGARYVTPCTSTHSYWIKKMGLDEYVCVLGTGRTNFSSPIYSSHIRVGGQTGQSYYDQGGIMKWSTLRSNDYTWREWTNYLVSPVKIYAVVLQGPLPCGSGGPC